VSGGYGSGGYPGQGDDGAGYTGDPELTRTRRRGGQRRDGSARGSEQGYPPYDGAGYGGRGYDDRGYDGPGYDDGRAYRDQGYGGQYDDRPRDDYADRGYDPRGYDEPEDGRRYPPAGPQPGQYGTGPRPARYGSGPRPGQHGSGAQPVQGRSARNSPVPPGYDQRGGTGPRRTAGGYDQRAETGYGQGRNEDWDEDQGDSSFLPGFGGRDDNNGGRGGSRAPERGARYDDGYDERPGRRGGRPGGAGDRGPGGRGPGGPGPDPHGWPDDPHGRDDRDDWDVTDHRPRKKATRWLPRILVLTVVAVIVIGGLVGGLTVYHKYEARYHPADYVGEGTGEVTVQVMNGDTAFSLAPRLLQLGVIASTRAFTNAAEATGTAGTSSTGLEAGYYQLHYHMQASLAYAALLNPKNLLQTVVTIPEGKRAVDVIAILSQKTKIPLKNFQQVIDHPSQLGLPSYANGKVEGYLFPATYAITPHETALQILQAMVQRFDVEAQQINIVAAAKAVDLSPAQLITEASLAQAEGGSVSDYPKIAEVIHNRLAIGMHLQFDSTVLYGLGKYAVSATFAQINTPGPYNTYLNAGLPPGPISNPGDAAIQGILHPDHGNWLYFLTVPGGKSQFSATPLTGQ